MDGIIDSVDISLSKLGELVIDRKPGVLQSIGSQRVRHDLNDSATTTISYGDMEL